MKAGKVRVSEALLLGWLQFDGGKIKHVELSSDIEGVVDIVIEHHEMPEVIEGDSYATICPTYITHQDNIGNQVAIREPLI